MLVWLLFVISLECPCLEEYARRGDLKDNLFLFFQAFIFVT